VTGGAVDSLSVDKFDGGATGANSAGQQERVALMANWLFKEEPSHYSFADLERDGSTVWNGVSNALALQNLRKVRPGDRVFFYHTGKEKAVVGVMEVAAAGPDKKDENAVAVTVRPVRRLQHPVSLSRIKSDKSLAGWELVRLPRLSVMPVTDAQWRRVEALSRKPGG
jgi:predicted RNA-binding protein with PUA-like domain